MLVRFAPVAVAFFLAGLSGCTTGGRDVNRTHGLAAKGYDVVAYFTLGQPTEGLPAHEHQWREAIWRFASAEHLAAFRTDPERYAPQYGGYCAWAMADGRKADIDPTAWRIVEGRLYLNYDADIQARWEADLPGFIARADEQWRQLGE